MPPWPRLRRMEELPLGAHFEDSVFEGGGGGGNGREPRGLSSLPTNYSARCCEPEWFCEETNSEDDAESVNIKKFRGDLAYKRQEFQKALCEYSGCLKLLPPSNLAMRRDILESQARCLAYLGRDKEALEITETLRNGATNTDHIAAILCLQLAIYCTLKQTERIIVCLQQLITLHPFHPRHWKSLAEAYMSLLQFPAQSSMTEADVLQHGSSAIDKHCLQVLPNEANFLLCKNHSKIKDASLHFSLETDGSCGSCEKCQTVQGPTRTLGKSEAQQALKRAVCCSVGQEGSQDIWIYACAAFIRARLLFQLIQLNQSSFALERNLKAQQEIEDQVASFGLKEDVLFLITEMMGEDLIPEKLKEDAQGEVKCLGASALMAMLNTSTVEFEKKWFQKLRERFSHLECQM
ncbi:uncharacterized protein C8orf76 homolog isoform X1 [Sceloporus undulatus]|uniref:uncharacterized protein C8orf76 homolog isoform X1 n=1 Tax=Sceloporus undulatus TaxID=8520 RepID=UPI001C4AFD3C|nr:uncharacterized protein C8orf76 homolog isoform X1 [Sceloporus undulatus]